MEIVGTYFTEKTVHKPSDAELAQLGEAAVRKLRQSGIEPFILKLQHGMDLEAINGAVLFFDKKQYTVRASSSNGLIQSADEVRYWLFAQPSQEQRLKDGIDRLVDVAVLHLDSANRRDLAQTLRVFGEGILRLAQEHVLGAGIVNVGTKGFARRGDELLGQIVDRLADQQFIEKAVAAGSHHVGKIFP